MGDIVSYITDMGHLSFNEMELNEVDSLVLSQLSNIHYSHCPPTKENFIITLNDIWSNYYNDKFVKETINPEKMAEFFKKVAKSTRYSSVKLGHFVSRTDFEREKQFSATTFDLGDNLYYISYRGTDASFVGWKEDFNLSFSSEIPSHKDAAEYLNNIFDCTDGKYIVGGHSKGGNLAIYAAASVPTEFQSSILDIYNHDGPGFLPEAFKSKEYISIREKIKKTIPQTSVVGMLMQWDENYSVVASNASFFMQHEPFAWMVEENSFVPLKQTDEFSRDLNKTIHTWLSNMDLTTRKDFSDSLYELVSSNGYVTYFDLLDAWEKDKKLVLRQLRGANTKTKRTVEQGIRSLLKISLKEMKDVLPNTIFPHL